MACSRAARTIPWAEVGGEPKSAAPPTQKPQVLARWVQGAPSRTWAEDGKELQADSGGCFTPSTELVSQEAPSREKECSLPSSSTSTEKVRVVVKGYIALYLHSTIYSQVFPSRDVAKPLHNSQPRQPPLLVHAHSVVLPLWYLLEVGTSRKLATEMRNLLSTVLEPCSTLALLAKGESPLPVRAVGADAREGEDAGGRDGETGAMEFEA